MKLHSPPLTMDCSYNKPTNRANICPVHPKLKIHKIQHFQETGKQGQMFAQCAQSSKFTKFSTFRKPANRANICPVRPKLKIHKMQHFQETGKQGKRLPCVPKSQIPRSKARQRISANPLGNQNLSQFSTMKIST